MSQTSKGWMRVREAAAMLSVSETTVRRRIAEGQLRGRSGKSGRQEVFVPAKLRKQAEQGDADQAVLNTPGNADVHIQAAAHTDDQEPASQDEQLKRFERLAGGSLVLAQKRADELTQAAGAAYENLAHTRDQLRQVRKAALVGWATAAGAVVLAFVLSLSFGLDSARSQARAQASDQAAAESADEARALRDRLVEAEQATSAAVGFESHAAVESD